MINLNRLDLLELKQRFNEQQSIRYVVIGDFIEEGFAKSIAKEHADVPEEYWLDYSHHNQKKFGLTNKKLMGKNTRLIIEELSSSNFIEWLSDLTGLDGLIVDPFLDRAGLHKIYKNGYLNVHTDEQSHTKHKYWKRRLNLLFYLSPDYEESWGGQLELWDYKKRKLIESIAPVFNRCIIFATNENSYHGHPKPLNCPEGTARRSLAIYYYQKTNKPLNISSTNYISLPGDPLKKRFLIKFNVFLLYLFAMLKRHTRMDDGAYNKMISYLNKK